MQGWTTIALRNLAGMDIAVPGAHEALP